MSRWFRHYAGMMRDDKLVRCAIRAKQTVERVTWVWGAILESAAEVDDAGRFDFDVPEAAYFLRADEADLRAVLDALAAAGHLDSDRVVKWGDRQFQSDRSAERQARYRDKRRGEKRDGDDQSPNGDGGVTSPSQRSDAPETDTELETKTEDKSRAPVSVASGARDLFDEVFETFPQNPSSNELKAASAFKALTKADQAKLLLAARRYAKWFEQDCEARKRTRDAGLRFVPHLSTWIETNAWREADALPIKGENTGPVVAMIRLDRDRDREVWLECERLSKPAPTSDSTWAFRAELVDKARSQLAGAAA